MTDETQHYFKAIEDVWCEMQGIPMLLSVRDFNIVRDWHSEGVPLELVEQTLRELFARKDRGEIRSLAYCKRAVASAWRRSQT